MKCSLLWLSIWFLPSTLLAQEGETYRITGQLNNMHAAKVYLIYVTNNNQLVDSVMVEDGRYVFTGKVSEGNPATLLDVSPFGTNLLSGDATTIFLTPGMLSITHVDSFSHCTVAGSPATAELITVLKDERPYRDRETELMPDYNVAREKNDEAGIKKIEERANAIEKDICDSVYAPFAKNNRRSPLSLCLLRSWAARDAGDSALPALFTGLSSDIRDSKAGKAFQKELMIAANTRIGVIAPDFSENDKTGKLVSLSSFRGKYVLLDFWASWCGPCRVENPRVASCYAQYHLKGFDILGVSLDKPGDRDKWLNAIVADGLVWTQVSDFQFWDNAAAKLYGIQSIPQNFLIDPQGKIIAKGLRGDDLQNKLAQLFHD